MQLGDYLDAAIEIRLINFWRFLLLSEKARCDVAAGHREAPKESLTTTTKGKLSENGDNRNDSCVDRHHTDVINSSKDAFMTSFAWWRH